MIVIRNRKMVIPYEDVYIGTSYDTNTEIRMFKVQRYTSNHKDLSALNFRLDLRYNITDQNAADTVMLSKEVHDDYILLKWEITESVLQAPGTAFINLRATENGTNRWSTFIAAVYIGHTLYTPGSYTGSLTEIEQMEADFDHFKRVIEDLEPLVNLTNTAEAWAVGQRNGHNVASDDVTYQNNSKWYATRAEHMAGNAYNYMGITEAMSFGTVDGEPVGSDDPNYHNNAKYYAEQANYHSNAAMTSSGHANDYKLAAEGWAVGQNGGADVASTDPSYHNNAKYYATQASGSAEQAAASAASKVNIPLDDNSQPTNGTNGQTLRTKGNGATEWADVGLPTDEQTAQAVSDWLDDHPEATTTVDFAIVTKVFPNVTRMLEDLTLVEGDTVQTLGYYAVNDGGGALYRIYDTAPSTYYETLSNGLYARLIFNEFVTPEMFGAKGDGSFDDTQAITQAFAAGYKVIGYNDYRISDTVNITGDCEFYGAIVFKRLSGSTIVRDRPALKIDGLTNSHIYIREIVDSQSYGSYAGVYHGWNNDDYAGIMVNGASKLELTVGTITNFSIGLLLKATGGVFFNLFRVLEIMNCRVGIEITNVDTGGWCNANLFYDTAFGYGETANGYIQDTQDHINVLITSPTAYKHNYNVFKNLRFESHYRHAGNYYGFYSTISNFTRLYDTRIEITGESNLIAFVADAINTQELHVDPFRPVKFLNYETSKNNIILNYRNVPYCILLTKDITTECLKYQSTGIQAWNGIKQIGILHSYETLKFANKVRYADFDADGNIIFNASYPAAIEIKNFDAGDVFEIAYNYGVTIQIRYYDANGNNITETYPYGSNVYYDGVRKALNMQTSAAFMRLMVPNATIKSIVITFIGKIKRINVKKYLFKGTASYYLGTDNASYVDTHESDVYKFNTAPTYVDEKHGVGTYVYNESDMATYYAIEKVNGSLAWVTH